MRVYNVESGRTKKGRVCALMFVCACAADYVVVVDGVIGVVVVRRRCVAVPESARAFGACCYVARVPTAFESARRRETSRQLTVSNTPRSVCETDARTISRCVHAISRAALRAFIRTASSKYIEHVL